KEPEKATRLLERARELLPNGPAERKELAGVLAAVGRNKEALALFEGVPLEVEDRRRLAALHAAEKNFLEAEEQCRAILREKPHDKNTQRQLADILSWKKDYSESLVLFEMLLTDSPQDFELLRRRAEVTLWSGAYDKALAHFQKLLTAQFEQ